MTNTEYKQKRKVVQIAAVPFGQGGKTCNFETVYALCDDGSMFSNNINNKRWIQLPPIPQPGDEDE